VRDNTITELRQDLKIANKIGRGKDLKLAQRNDELADAKHTISTITVAAQKALRDYQHDRRLFHEVVEQITKAARTRIVALFILFSVALVFCVAQSHGKVPARFLYVREIVREVPIVEPPSCNYGLAIGGPCELLISPNMTPRSMPLPASPAPTNSDKAASATSSDNGETEGESPESGDDGTSTGGRGSGREGKGPQRLAHRKEKRKAATAEKNARERARKAEGRVNASNALPEPQPSLALTSATATSPKLQRGEAGAASVREKGRGKSSVV
jgi:hypothetical protein